MTDFSCNEVLLDDVVAIDIHLASGCSFNIPSNVCVKEIPSEGVSLDNAFFKARLDLSGDAMMNEIPSVKISSSKTAAGCIYTHDIQIPVLLGRFDADSLQKKLVGIDFHIIYIHDDGSREISRALPNASACDIENTLSAAQSVLIKLKISSYSNLISIV